MTTESEMRAEQARQLLNNPLFEEAFFNTREAIVTQIESTAILDKDFRNELGLALQSLAAVKSQIDEHINTAMLDMDEETNSPK